MRCFLEICSISDPANPQFWCSRLGAVRFFEFSSNRKQIQNERKISPKWLPKSTKKPLKIKTKINQKSHQIFHRFLPQNGAKMSPKWEGKKWENLALGTLGGQRGTRRAPKAPEEPQSPKNEAQGSPQTPEMDPKRSPETPKWCPSDPPTSQNGAQEAPGQAPEMCARSLHDRTNIQTDAKITTQQAATQTRKIKRPGGMREAIE